MLTSEGLARLRPPLALGRIRHIALTDGRVLFLGLTIVYLILAAIVTLGAHSVVTDTWARVANAYYVLFSRDPHLAAIGFVWLPLPSLLYLPLIAVHDIWPPLVEDGFAANIVSALFMAGAAYQVLGWLEDLRLSRILRLLLVLVFALHPMIVYYGANGMSEAIFLFFAIATGRYLTRWIAEPEPRTLVVVGGLLAAAYLTRYEALAMAGGVIGLVGVLAFARQSGGRRRRFDELVSDTIVVGLPFMAVFVGWALASWFITGHPFEQFSSIYGNERQIELGTEFLGGLTGRGSIRAFGYASDQILGLVPLLALPVSLVFLIPVARRDLRPLALVVTLGAIVAMSLFVFLMGRSNGFLRFYIGVVPVAIVCVGFILAAARERTISTTSGDGALDRVPPRLQRFGLACLLLAGLVISVPVGYRTMITWSVAREESEQLATVLETTAVNSYTVDHYLGVRALADYLDELDLPRGAVLLDTFALGPVVLSSTNPKQFVVTSDRDFKAIVAAPADFDVEYIAVPRNEGLTSIDAINLEYPEMWDNGGGLATFVGEFGSKGGVDTIRLYRLER